MANSSQASFCATPIKTQRLAVRETRVRTSLPAAISDLAAGPLHPGASRLHSLSGGNREARPAVRRRLDQDAADTVNEIKGK